jgi:uncharacterized membrane protein YkoI
MTLSRFTHAFCPPLLAAVVLILCQTSQADELFQGDLGLPDQGQSNSLIAPPVAEDEPLEPQLTPADAANLVRQQTGGQVMSVSTKQLQSGTVYGVKILNSGRMRVVLVDGQTGELINP